MAEIYAFPPRWNQLGTFARGDAAEAAGADNPPIFTAIPRGTSWAIKAVASNGTIQTFGRFDGRLPALGAAVLMAAQVEGRVLP